MVVRWIFHHKKGINVDHESNHQTSLTYSHQMLIFGRHQAMIDNKSQSSRHNPLNCLFNNKGD